MFISSDNGATWQQIPKSEAALLQGVLLPNGDVLTPGGIRHPGEEDPDRDLGIGWLEAEPFCDGIARVLYEDTWETISWPPAAR